MKIDDINLSEDIYVRVKNGKLIVQSLIILIIFGYILCLFGKYLAYELFLIYILFISSYFIIITTFFNPILNSELYFIVILIKKEKYLKALIKLDRLKNENLPKDIIIELQNKIQDKI